MAHEVVEEQLQDAYGTLDLRNLTVDPVAMWKKRLSSNLDSRRE